MFSNLKVVSLSVWPDDKVDDSFTVVEPRGSTCVVAGELDVLGNKTEDADTLDRVDKCKLVVLNAIGVVCAAKITEEA